MWFSLPVELQRHCLQSLDVETLRSCRLVSKALSTLTTEILFSTVSLLPSEESAEKYNIIIKEDRLRPLVRTVIFNTSEDPDEQDDDNPEEVDLEPYFKKSLKKVSQFTNLREVQLKFSRLCAVDAEVGAWDKEVAETVSFRTDVLRALFKGLNNAAYPLPHFDTLVIKNLQDYVPSLVYDSEDFKAVMGKVKKLALCIATETDDACPEDSINKPGCHKMFTTDLTTHWLAPLQSQLTHLSLYATECFWGFWPFSDLRAVHFPNLQSLSLGNWTIAHEWQVEWILSHAETLEELLLDDCPIITIAKMDDKIVAPHFPGLPLLYHNERLRFEIYMKQIDLRWHHVLPRLRTGLPHLTRFAMGHGNWDEMRMWEERYELEARLSWGRYCMFDDGIGPSQWVMEESRGANHSFFTGKEREKFMFPECEEEDREALGELLEVVGRRARAKL